MSLRRQHPAAHLIVHGADLVDLVTSIVIHEDSHFNLNLSVQQQLLSVVLEVQRCCICVSSLAIKDRDERARVALDVDQPAPKKRARPMPLMFEAPSF
mgnify:CR=1 FL=1